MEYLFTSENIISFFILVILEIVLGIDNVIFVSIIINQLEESEQDLDLLLEQVAPRSAARADELVGDGANLLARSIDPD